MLTANQYINNMQTSPSEMPQQELLFSSSYWFILASCRKFYTFRQTSLCKALWRRSAKFKRIDF